MEFKFIKIILCSPWQLVMLSVQLRAVSKSKTPNE